MEQCCPVEGVAKRIGGRGCGGFSRVGFRTRTEGPLGDDGKPRWLVGALYCGQSACREAAGHVNDESREKNKLAQQQRRSGVGKAESKQPPPPPPLPNFGASIAQPILPGMQPPLHMAFAYAQPMPPPQPPPPSATLHLQDQLRELMQWKKEGLLNDAEFTAAKARLLPPPPVADAVDAAKDPTTLDQAADMVLSILRGLKRADEIDQAVSGAYDGASLGLAAECDNDDSPDTTLTANTALLASLTKSGATAAQLAMIASALTPVADPNKPGPNKPKDTPKVEVPRDKDGNVTKWIPGMNTCRCGVNGGRHLFRDCPKLLEKKAKAEKEEKAKAEQAKADKTKAAALLANVSDASEAELRTALMALLGGK